MNPVTSSQTKTLDPNSLKDHVPKHIKDPAKLILLFEKTVKTEQQETTIDALFKNIHLLDDKKKFNNDQIITLMYLTLQLPWHRDEDWDFFNKHLSYENVFLMLDHANKIGNSLIREKCLNCIEDHLGLMTYYLVNVYSKNEQLVVKINKPKVNFKTLSTEINRLKLIYKVKIFLRPSPACDLLSVKNFLEVQGEVIDILDIMEFEKINDDFFKTILKFCVNLSKLEVTLKNTNLDSLNDLHHLKSLTDLSFSGSDLVHLPKLPKNLTHLDLSYMPKLQKLPILSEKLKTIILKSCFEIKALPAVSKNLEKMDVNHCRKLNDDYRVDYLIEVFSSNIKQGLQLYPFFGIKNMHKLGRMLMTKLTPASIIAHYETIKKTLPMTVHSYLLVPIINSDIQFFLNHMDDFSFCDLDREITDKAPILKKSKDLMLTQLCEEHFSENNSIDISYNTNDSDNSNDTDDQVEIDETEIDNVGFNIDSLDEVTMEGTPEIEEVSLDRLLTLFDAINFSNPEMPFYVNPQYLTIDGVKKDIKDLRKGIETLLNYIKGRIIYQGVPHDSKNPEDEEIRENWYLRLEGQLQEILKLFDIEENKPLIANELIRLGMAGDNCGTRWVNESADIILSLKANLPKVDNIYDLTLGFISDYIREIIGQLTMEYTPELEGMMQPHYFNYIAKIFSKIGQLPSDVGFDEDDDMLTSDDLPKDIIKDKVREFLHPLRIAKFVQDKIAETLKTKPILGELILIPFTEYATLKLKKQIKAIEDTLKEKQISCGLSIAGFKLKNCKITKAILEEDTTAILLFKKTDALKVLEIKQTLTKQASEKEKSNKRKATTELIEGAQRGGKKHKTSEEVMYDENVNELKKYEFYLHNPAEFSEELATLGSTIAHQNIRFEIEELISSYLAENNLCTNNIDDGSVDVSFEGTLVLLEQLSILIEK